LIGDDLVFTEHAVDRMAERGILVQEVIEVLTHGEEIEVSYQGGRPYPTILSLGFPGGAPLHVLWAKQPESGKILIVTTYVPDAARWHSGFRGRTPLA
jgi:Domain of unknown function (DUF4258)